MPRPSCDPCCNPTELSRGVESFRSAQLIILCDLLAAITGGGVIPAPTAAVWAYSSTAFGSIGAAFGNALVNSASLKNIKFSNLTDQDVEVSFDGTNVHDYVRAGEIEIRDLNTNNVFVNTNIRIRYVTIPTVGSFKISAFS